MYRQSLYFLILCLIAAFASCVKSNKIVLQETNNRVQQLDSLFHNLIKEDKFHGGIVISSKGVVVYEKYFGIANRTWNIPVSKEVKFDVASINKSFIAALIMKAVESGKLSLQDRLADKFQEYNITGSFSPEIRIHNLLSHTSGLADYGDISKDLQTNNFLNFKRKRFSNEEYVDFISNLPYHSNPNEEFYYSNFAYHLLAILLEDTYQEGFEEILQKNLCKPIGLKNTISSSRNEEVIPSLAVGYIYDSEKSKWQLTPFIDRSLGRRIYSTPSDLNRWAQVMDNPGYLTKISLDLIQQNHLSRISKEISYGYGWFVIDSDNTSRIGKLDTELPHIIHGGSTDAYKSMLVNINKSDYVISFLSNVGNRTEEMLLARKIVNILTN